MLFHAPMWLLIESHLELSKDNMQMPMMQNEEFYHSQQKTANWGSQGLHGVWVGIKGRQHSIFFTCWWCHQEGSRNIRAEHSRKYHCMETMATKSRHRVPQKPECPEIHALVRYLRKYHFVENRAQPHRPRPFLGKDASGLEKNSRSLSRWLAKCLVCVSRHYQVLTGKKNTLHLLHEISLGLGSRDHRR